MLQDIALKDVPYTQSEPGNPYTLEPWDYTGFSHYTPGSRRHPLSPLSKYYKNIDLRGLQK